MIIEGLDITWLGHACFKVKAGKTIYFDPFQLKSDEPADFILITHDHYDHCSLADIKKVATPKTIIFATPDCQSKLSSLNVRNVTLLEPGKKVAVDGLTIEAVPAYNTNKRFHPKENGWLGYILTVGGKRIYHAGDTDLIPEMQRIKADIALLPVSGTYVMTAEEAAKAADIIKPKVAIPMHCGSIVGTLGDAERFKSLAKANVMVMTPP
ncbi:MAG: MBL fold metallo-hydrolase [Nanoarchaeota archaeon]